MKIIGRTYLCFFHQMPFFIGCTLGIALSLIVMPLVEEHCLWHRKELTANGRSFKRPMSQSTRPEMVDEYEPIVNLRGKSKKTISRPEKLQIVRPRYYSTELGIKEKIFIGILTTPSTVMTLGSALNKTLWKHANKVVFFVEGTIPQNIALASVVAFPDKREVLAPFHMLQYIADNFINDYDFFFFAKDTTHIRGMKLYDFVSHISISQHVHVGQQISADSLYCSLDAGVLLSNSIMKKTVQDIEWCVQHTFSDLGSDNFGRCILHGTSQACVSKIQGRSFVSHHVSKYNSLEASILKSSWQKDLKNAVTVYSISNQEEHYLLHHYFCYQGLADNQQEIHEIEEKIVNISHMLPANSNKVSWPIGIEPSFKPHNRFDVIQWIYFNESHSFLLDELTVISELKGIYDLEIQDILKSVINWVRNKYSDKYIFQKLINGYKRFDPTRGMEYVLDLEFLEDERGKSIVKRLDAVRPINEVEIIPVPFVTEHTRIILLLIVQTSERSSALKFLEDYAKACLDKQDNTVLLLVFLYGPEDPGKGDKDDVFGALKVAVNTYTNKYRAIGAKIAWLSVRTTGNVPPGIAIMDLVVRKLTADSMILLCQVGMEIHPEYLNRVRMNTIMQTQVFFPIPFVQYHPAVAYKHLTLPDEVEVKKDLGHFDTQNYAHSSFYLADFLAARKTIESKIPIIKSDKDLKHELLYDVNFGIYEMFLKSKLVHVVRAVEPDLRIRFSMPLCEPKSNTEAYRQCLRSREIRLGTKAQLAAAILSHTENESSVNIEQNADL